MIRSYKPNDTIDDIDFTRYLMTIERKPEAELNKRIEQTRRSE